MSRNRLAMIDRRLVQTERDTIRELGRMVHARHTADALATAAKAALRNKDEAEAIIAKIEGKDIHAPVP